MYTAYFGLKEKPFSIAPDPQYLFMSDRHREALAHLTYGLGDTGGFALLTGEVGTGKTTISRCLMEQLPDNTHVAFILNPMLSSQELLATICDELKIRYRKTGATLKTLTDKIQEKLLKNHQKKINTLLIIDEAQHLQPEVLEQLRLLTNLETNTKKLLQVILIGQPELQTLLKRRDLRQLAQRITARYHLLPLNPQEISLYIKHRLSVAHCFREVFSKAAIVAMHQICQGIPRLINLVCERALINAYSNNNTTIDKKSIITAAQDALGDDYYLPSWWQNKSIKIFAACTVLSALVFTGYHFGQNQQGSTETVKKMAVGLVDKSKVIMETSSIAVDDNVNNEKITDSTVLVDVDDASLESKGLKQEEIIIQKDIDLPKTVIKQKNKIEIAAIETVEDKEAKKIDYQVDAVEGVSESLLARVQEAIEETTDSEQNIKTETQTNEDILPLVDMPQWLQNSLPNIVFTMHIYASDGAGWVTVNGRDRYEGDYIDRELLLSEILPQKVVLNFRGEKFTMAALSSW